MISYKEAIKKLNKSYLSIKSETIFSKDSLYRICSKNIYCKFDYPAANNSALMVLLLTPKKLKMQIKIIKLN